jgi:hypothetical protein
MNWLNAVEVTEWNKALEVNLRSRSIRFGKRHHRER